MAKDYRIASEEGYVRVSYFGKTRYDVATEMLHELIHICEKMNSRSILFDLSQADYSDTYVASMQHVKDLPGIGYDASYRFAVLGSGDDDGILQYIENVAVNRGLNVRTFVEELDAIEWLREPRSAPQVRSENRTHR